MERTYTKIAIRQRGAIFHIVYTEKQINRAVLKCYKIFDKIFQGANLSTFENQKIAPHCRPCMSCKIYLMTLAWSTKILMCFNVLRAEGHSRFFCCIRFAIGVR